MVLNVKNFSDELHYEAKVQAAVEGISLKELIEKSLREYLKSAKKKGGSDEINLWV
jgi:predicted HicB family RNase H-like nuclease